MHATHILIADDLTGGNDSGIHFARSGFEARMLVNPWRRSVVDVANVPFAPGEGPGVLVLNTDTRNLQVQDVSQRIRDSLAFLGPHGKHDFGRIVFKKIDSTLRGNLGASMDAIMDVLKFDCVFFAPSYPQQGRKVSGGKLLVHGRPVHETEFARDPLSPVRDSYLPRLLTSQSDRKSGLVSLEAVKAGPSALEASVRALRSEGCSVIIFDAEEQEHLETIAQTSLAQAVPPLLMGSAGFAKGLADCLAQIPGAAAGRKEKAERHSQAAGRKTLFFVCGSVNQATREQVKELGTASGVSLFMLPEGHAVATREEELGRDIAWELGRGPSILATPALAHPGKKMNGQENIASSLGRVAKRVLTNTAVEAGSVILFLTGGETALSVLESLGIPELRLEKEIMPGIVLTRVMGGDFAGMTVITKAGGFGEPGALRAMLSLI